MTTKTKTVPAAPTAPTVKKVNQTLEQEFWALIMEVQQLISDIGFGQNKGKGGSILKDSNALKKKGHDLFNERGITYDIVADDVTLQVIESNNVTPQGDVNPSHRVIVSGYYTDKWFYKGQEVYQSKRFGGFDTVLAPSTNSNYAVQGATTSATTVAMFQMLKANTKSDEEFSRERELNEQRQPRNAPTKTYTDVPY